MGILQGWPRGQLHTVDSEPAPHPMTEKEIKLVIGAHADVAANLLKLG